MARSDRSERWSGSSALRQAAVFLGVAYALALAVA
jgi:hypothetical protein